MGEIADLLLKTILISSKMVASKQANPRVTFAGEPAS